MRRRVFVTINLPEDVKEKLWQVSEKWSELPVRWTKKDNLHITMCFVGEADEDTLFRIRESLDTVVPNHSRISIHLNGVTLGPSEFNPRMIWANGEVGPEFKNLIKDLHDRMPECGCGSEKINNFKLHITLARIKEIKPGRLNKIPPVREELDVGFWAGSVELMESRLLKGGSEYIVLHSAELKKI